MKFLLKNYGKFMRPLRYFINFSVKCGVQSVSCRCSHKIPALNYKYVYCRIEYSAVAAGTVASIALFYKYYIVQVPCGHRSDLPESGSTTAPAPVA